MKYRIPSRIGRKLSVIGFGAWQLGNPEFFTTMDDSVALELVETAVEKGVNVFDTAPGYGSGNSERLLGIGLKNCRENVFINTKFGHTVDHQSDFSVAGLVTSVEGSLERLQTNYLDGLILHNPGEELLYGNTPVYDKLQQMKQEGIIRHYGVSIDTKHELDIVLKHNDVDIIEIMYNIIHQSPRELFDQVEKKGILLLIKVPLDSGWLTGKYTENTTFDGIRSRWTKDVINTRLSIVERIKGIVGRDNIVHDSIQFILQEPAVTSVIAGVRTKEQLLSNVKSADHVLDQEKVDELMQLYYNWIQDLNTPW